MVADCDRRLSWTAAMKSVRGEVAVRAAGVARYAG